MAKVVFSNGSKAMAHNLNDQYERWQIRREELAKENPYLDAKEGLDAFVPELPPLESREQAELLRSDLLSRLEFVQQKIAESRMRPGRITSFDAKRNLEPLYAAQKKIQTQLAQVKSYVKLQNIQNKPPSRPAKNDPLREAKELRQKGVLDGLTVEEELHLAQMTFDLDMASNEGERRLIKGILKAGNALEALGKQSEHIERVTKQLAGVQAKLILAYERIIELESER